MNETETTGFGFKDWKNVDGCEKEIGCSVINPRDLNTFLIPEKNETC